MGDTIDLRLQFYKLLNKWYYFAISLILSLGLGYTYYKFSKKIYEVEATILLDNVNDNRFGNQEEFINGLNLFKPNTKIADEIGLIKSANMVKEAIDQLDFGISFYAKENFMFQEVYNAWPFSLVLDSISSQIVNVPIYIQFLSEQEYLLVAEGEKVSSYNLVTQEVIPDRFAYFSLNKRLKVGEKYSDEYLSFTLNLNENSGTYIGQELSFTIRDPGSLTGEYQDKLKAAPMTMESNIVRLSTQGTVVAKEVKFVNALIRAFLDSEVNKKTQIGLRTINFLDQQLANITDSLQKAESTLENFRATNNIIDISTTSENLILKLDDLQDEQAKLSTEIEYYRYILEYLRNNDDYSNIVAPSSVGVQDVVLNSLLLEISELNRQRASYSSKENNPLFASVDLKISNVRNALIENVTNIINTTTINLRGVQQRIASINGSLNKLPENERELVKIQRKFEFSDNIYNYLLQKRTEAGIAIASNMVSRTIVDDAKVIGKKPVSPKRTLILVTALIAGLFIPMAIVLGQDFFNDKVMSQHDVKEVTDIPILSSVPKGDKRFKLPSLFKQRSILAESFKSQRINLQYIAAGRDKNVIGVTSSIPNEGKSFCAINLANSLAFSGKKVLLIEGDLRKPGLQNFFMIESNSKGLSSYLIRESTLDDVIHSSNVPNLDLIHAGAIPPNPLELIELPRMESMISTLKEIYDYIIIDTPPVLLVSDFYIISNYTDINIFVVRYNFTKKRMLESLAEISRSKNLKKTGIVLNAVNFSMEYGYNYGYYAKGYS